tara:strand:- start:410 stop:652 length:243 start_codon:yes stop_codon:yes gene_type:complete
MTKKSTNDESEDKDLKEIFDRLFEMAMRCCEKYPSQMVAGTYMAIAIRMYKTVLAPEEFKMMMETVSESDVEAYKGPSVH